MATLEAEALLLGIWRNVEELEESLCLEELEALISASREKEHRHNKFMAALKGIDIDEGDNDAQERVEQIKREAAAQAKGVTVEALELEAMGVDIIEEG